jgi:hypothetical protein
MDVGREGLPTSTLLHRLSTSHDAEAVLATYSNTRETQPLTAQHAEGAPTAGAGLTPQKVREFQSLMREECGAELSMEDARRRATQLIALYRALLGPLPEDPEAEGSGMARFER